MILSPRMRMITTDDDDFLSTLTYHVAVPLYSYAMLHSYGILNSYSIVFDKAAVRSTILCGKVPGTLLSLNGGDIRLWIVAAAWSGVSPTISGIVVGFLQLTASYCLVHGVPCRRVTSSVFHQKSSKTSTPVSIVRVPRSFCSSS